MPVSEYVCPAGHRTETYTSVTTTRPDTILCGSDCSEIARRKFSFGVNLGIQPHYNMALGRYVRNERDFRDGLKYAAEKQATDMGYETSYDYVDPADITQSPHTFGVTEEGLDATRRRHHDAALAGLTPDEFAARETPSQDD